MAFERWSNDITAASDTEAQRKLLAEISAWRASHLTDIPGLREAAFAMSTLYSLVGERDSAVREARSLLSLCQTAPIATREERQHAKAYLSSLGEKAPPLRVPNTERGSRRNREPRERKPKTSPLETAIERAVAGDHKGALKLLRGKKGRADLVRAWIRLDLALKSEDREAELASLDRWLRQILRIDSAPVKVVERRDDASPPGEADGPLAHLLGRKLPKRRQARVRLMERWLESNPGKADTLAATALRDHLAEAGPEIPAPWLVAFVARARLAGSEQTDVALAELEAAGSRAVEIYGEWAFGRALALAATAPERFSGLRRGVLGRKSEPDDRRAWTLRLDGDDRMLVLVPRVEGDYPADVAQQMAQRLPTLCSRTVLLAAGASNGPLREAVAGAGIVTLDGDPSDTELLSALDAVKPVEAPKKPVRAAREAPAPQAAKAAPAPEKAAPPKVDPLEAVTTVLFQEAVPTVDDLAVPVEGLRKLREAFLAADKAWSTFPADASARLAALMHAAHRSAPETLSVPEGTTLGLRVAAAQGGPTQAALLEGGTSERFGGPGMSDVLGLVKAASGAGWGLRRAFQGTTRRERRNNAALETLSGSLGGVWRLGLEKGDQRLELWYIATLPVEGRAAVPQLLLEERERVVVLPIDPELSAWWGTLDGPEAIGWTPEDPIAVVEALTR